MAAYHSDGTPDSSFGSGGQLTVSAGVATGTRAIHIGDLFLRAFGDIAPDGKVVVGASSQTSSPGASSGLHRLNVAGSGLLGSFGAVSGHNRKLVFLDSDGTRVTITLKGGGSGQAYYDGTNIDLILNGTTPASALSLKGVGGDGRINLRDIRSGGPLRSLTAKAADLSGTLSITGGLGAVTLGSVTGTIAVSGSIGTVTLVGNATGAMILAGANFGSDGKAGGTDTATDAYGPGSIGKIQISGTVKSSVFGAGLDPVNGVFLDSDDRVLGGTASLIKSVAIKGGIDDGTRFVAGAFGKAKLPGKVDVSKDSHFEILGA